MYSNGARPSSRQDIQSTAKLTGVDEARIRKFAEEQARLERAHTPASSSPLADQAIRKFADEQARLHRAHSPEISRNDTHLKFAEEQARLRRTHSPELPRNDSQSKFAEEQARLNRTHSPDILRSESRPRPVHNPTGSSPGSTESARLAAFAEQQLRAQAQYAQESRNGTNSRLGQNAQTLRSKPSVPAYVPTGKRQSTFGRFPLNEPEDIRSMYDDDRTLSKVEVLFFDLDGTVLNWQGTVADELRRLGKNVPEFKRINWDQFALKWRDLYLETMRGISERGDSVSTNTVYRTTLDQLLSKESPKFVTRMTPTVRSQLADVWDRANGRFKRLFHRKPLKILSTAWPDTKDGLQAIQKTKTIATLSNMSLRTQTQMSRHAGLSWDVCLSGSLLGSYKPNPEAYLEAARSMSLVASKCAVVSSHFDELRVAGDAGMKTIYVRRPSEDRNIEAEITTKAERGYFDIVVDSFEHLAIVLGCDD
ncbi:HAD-like domain-containing protein [Mycena vitilis]|nr:HAD-like domain-containing protein [Mycena vitilis]